MSQANQFRRLLAKTKMLPPKMQSRLITFALRQKIPYTKTSRMEYLEVSEKQVVVHVKNKRPIRNHIGGVHAIASTLAGESATGICLAVHLPDNKLPLLQSMNLTFVKRGIGDVTAIASITPEQIALCQSEERGTIEIPVTYCDGEGKAHITGSFFWAWVPKKTGAIKT